MRATHGIFAFAVSVAGKGANQATWSFGGRTKAYPVSNVTIEFD